MKVKKISIFVAMAMALILVFTACGDSGAAEAPPAEDTDTAAKTEETDSEKAVEETVDATEEEEKPAVVGDDFTGYKIAYSCNSVGNEFGYLVYSGVKANGEACGMEVLFGENAMDPQKVEQNIQVLKANGMDVLIDFNIVPQVSGKYATSLKAEGIPTITVDVEIGDDAYFFGADNKLVGTLAGEYIANYANENWGGQLDNVFIEGCKTQGEVVLLRSTSTFDGLDNVMPGNTFEDTHFWCDPMTAPDQVQKVSQETATFLQNNPGKLGFAAHDDAMAVPIVAAIKDAGREDDCIVVSLGCYSTFQQQLRDDPNTCWKGAITFFPEQYGAYLVDIAKQLIKGEAVPPVSGMLHKVIDMDNLDEYYPVDEPLTARVGTPPF